LAGCTPTSKEAPSVGVAERAIESGCSNPALTYHNGAVLPRVEVTTVFWGNGVWFGSDINTFYDNVLNSDYMDWLTEYNVPGYASFGRGTRAGMFVDWDAPMANTIDDSLIQQRLSALVQFGALPRQDGNRLFAVYFPPAVGTITAGSQSSCNNFCAYHSSFVYGGQRYPYAVIPNQACSPSSVFSSQACLGVEAGNDFELSTFLASSHELMEAITDPYGNGWYDDNPSCNEIGDICQGVSSNYGTENGEQVQQVWSNSRNRCLTNNTNDFTIWISPSGQSASNGQTVRYHVTSADTGTRLPITLSTVDLSGNVRGYFDRPIIISGMDTYLNVSPQFTPLVPTPMPFLIRGTSPYEDHILPVLLTVTR
jgi:hypothetical protein